MGKPLRPDQPRLDQVQDRQQQQRLIWCLTLPVLRDLGVQKIIHKGINHAEPSYHLGTLKPFAARGKQAK